jgi:hypothetical protein
MPLYTFKKKDTDEQYNKIMSYEELLDYLRNNKDIHQVFKMNIFRYSDNNGAKDQFTEWAKDSSINDNGEFKTYGKAQTDYDKKQQDKKKDKA